MAGLGEDINVKEEWAKSIVILCRRRIVSCFWSGKLPIKHFVWVSAGDRDRPTVRPGYPFFLLRSYHIYSINNSEKKLNSSYCAVTTDIQLTIDKKKTFNSSYCAVNTNIDQKTMCFSFQVLLYALYIDKDNLLLPHHQNDDRSCFFFTKWDRNTRRKRIFYKRLKCGQCPTPIVNRDPRLGREEWKGAWGRKLVQFPFSMEI